MTNEELTYAKEAKRKHGANVVEQEFAQPKHHKDPPEEQQKKQISLRNQPARNKLQEAILYHYSRLARGKPSS